MRALLLVALCAGCTAASVADAGSDASPDAGADVSSDAGLPGCAGSLDPVICSGTVDPTGLGPGIDPVEAGITGGAPGQHWFCTPGEGEAWNGRTLVYLVGTYGDPADEHALPARACALGFVAVAPMYENRDMARVVCGDDGPCYEAFHAEIAVGIPGAPDPVDVSPESSIEGRLRTLLEHLATRGAPWTSVRDALAADDWSETILAGHSQGAGHAGYLARDLEAERLVMLAGPSDRIGSGTAANAPPPWIEALETTPLRTTLRFGMIHDDDDFEVVPQVVDDWDRMGVPDGTCAHDRTGYAAACRRIRAPSEGCAGIAAHLTPILPSWGARCREGGPNENPASWDHLLLAGP